MKEGKTVDFSLRYKSLEGSAFVVLMWSSPSVPLEKIPSRNLFHQVIVGDTAFHRVEIVLTLLVSPKLARLPLYFLLLEHEAVEKLSTRVIVDRGVQRALVGAHLRQQPLLTSLQPASLLDVALELGFEFRFLRSGHQLLRVVIGQGVAPVFFIDNARVVVLQQVDAVSNVAKLALSDLKLAARRLIL